MTVMFPSLLKVCQRRYVVTSLGILRRVTATDSQLCQVSHTSCGARRGRAAFGAVGRIATVVFAGVCGGLGVGVGEEGDEKDEQAEEEYEQGNDGVEDMLAVVRS